MRVEEKSINGIFINNNILRIPFFQRGYVWEKKNWEMFFDDIAEIASLIKEKRDPEVYFLGSIILKDIGNVGRQKFDVIDGQQRLTTIVLFMKALCLVMDRDDVFKRTFMLDDLISNNEIPILVPNHNDKEQYDEIISLQDLCKVPSPESRLTEAFKYFVDRIKDAQNPTDGSMSISPINLYLSITDYVRLVCIIVKDAENAQKIFETINCAGIKLTTGEMLKNYLYSDEDISEYERTWKPVFERNKECVKYWEGEIVKGRTKDGHIENFFYRYMLVKMQEPNIKHGLSSNEIKFYRQRGDQFNKWRTLRERFNIEKMAIAREIVEHAKAYYDIFTPDTLDDVAVNYSGVERLSYLMIMQDMWTMTPYILYIYKNVEEGERNRIFQYLESYLMRRIICKSTNNNYSDLFSENLIGQNVCTVAAFKEYVNDREARGSLLMPSDEDVKEAICKNNLKSDAHTILYMLESLINSEFTSSKFNNSANSFVKEQIMIDNVNWPSASGYTEEQRSVLINTLGNFMITRNKLKKKDSSSGWMHKKVIMEDGVKGLFLGRIFSQGLNKWDESIIEKCNQKLYKLVVEKWPI